MKRQIHTTRNRWLTAAAATITIAAVGAFSGCESDANYSHGAAAPPKSQSTEPAKIKSPLECAHNLQQQRQANAQQLNTLTQPPPAHASHPAPPAKTYSGGGLGPMITNLPRQQGVAPTYAAPVVNTTPAHQFKPVAAKPMLPVVHKQVQQVQHAPPPVYTPPAQAAAFSSTPDDAVVVGESQIAVNSDTGFAISAFPPTIPDQEWHQEAWITDDCLRCHETGVADAPRVRHRGLPPIALESKCRSCHVLVPGKTESNVYVSEAEEAGFFANAFPPMIPNSESHIGVWGDLNCLTCHKKGKKGATKVIHKGMPDILLEAKCRTCHVQIRSNETSPWDE